MKTITSKQTEENEVKEKQLWRVNNWMKGIFIDESRICIGQGDDAETLVWCRSNETYKDYLNKWISLLIYDMELHTFKGYGTRAIIISVTNVHVDIEIQDKICKLPQRILL